MFIITTKKLIYGCSFIAYVAGLATHFAALMPESIKYLLYAASLACGFFSILLGYAVCSNRNVKQYLGLWILFIFYLLIVGLIQSGVYSEGTSVNIFLSQDLRFVMYIGLGILLADYFDDYVKMMSIFAFAGIVMGVIALANYNFSYAGAVEGDRMGLWSLPYYLWWASESVYAFMYPYSRITNRYKIFGYGSLICYAVLGLLFIKRASLVNVFVVLIFSEILANPSQKGNAIKFIFKISLVIGSVAFVAYSIPYSKALVQAMLERFGSQGNIMEYDRAREAAAVFAQMSFPDKVFGLGIGYYIKTSRTINALHTGFYNLIYKGGILLLLMYIYELFQTVKNFIRMRKLSEIERVCLCTSIAYCCCVFYEGSWSYTIYMLQYVTPIVALLTHSYKSKGDGNNESLLFS